jgi:hypothetical protein
MNESERQAEIDRLTEVIGGAIADLGRAIGSIQETERWYQAEKRKLDARYGSPSPNTTEDREP